MSWRDAYIAGSFRGVPFVTQSSERQGGRRGELHEYPRRDEPWREDLGRRARLFSLELFVFGPDHRDQRDRLIDALEANGAGTLVHPWYGVVSVAVDDFTARDDTESGGITMFQVTFLESGERVETPVAADTQARSAAAADAAQQDGADQFADGFDVDGVASFVDDAAQALVTGFSAASTLASGLMGGSGAALHAFQAIAGYLPDNVAALVRAPIDLAASVIGLVQTTSALGRGTAARLLGLGELMQWGGNVPAVLGATPARQRQRDNQAAFIDMAATATAAEIVRAIADTDFTSYDDAIATRDRFVALFDDRILAAADAGRDVAAEQLRALRQAMIADITTRGGSLARLYRYTPARTEPALVIVNRLYGVRDAFDDRLTDLIDRNRLRHPGFVAGGVPLQVLEASSG